MISEGQTVFFKNICFKDSVDMCIYTRNVEELKKMLYTPPSHLWNEMGTPYVYDIKINWTISPDTWSTFPDQLCKYIEYFTNIFLYTAIMITMNMWLYFTSKRS